MGLCVLSLDYRTIPKLHSSVNFFNHELSRNNEQFLGHCTTRMGEILNFTMIWLYKRYLKNIYMIFSVINAKRFKHEYQFRNGLLDEFRQISMVFIITSCFIRITCAYLSC